MRPFIPRPIYQSLIILLLPGAACLAAYEWVSGTGLYAVLLRALGGTAGAGLIGAGATLAGYLLAVAALALALRPLTAGMPTLRDQLRSPQGAGAPPGTPASRERALAAAMVALGIGFALLAAAAVRETGGDLYRWQVILGLLGAGLVGWGVVRLLTSGRGR